MATGKIEKIDTQASIEILTSGAYLIRLGNIRILSLNNYAGGNASFTIPTADCPSSNMTPRSVCFRTDSNQRSTAMGFIQVNPSGTVNLFYAGSYNVSGSGSSFATTSDRITGQCIWTI